MESFSYLPKITELGGVSIRIQGHPGDRPLLCGRAQLCLGDAAGALLCPPGDVTFPLHAPLQGRAQGSGTCFQYR